MQHFWSAFLQKSPYKKRAKWALIGWTLLIFIACFIPGNEIPILKVPFIDKWVHFILFGVWSLLAMLAAPSMNHLRLILVAIAAALLGYGVEELQGCLSFLGRAKDIYDIYADAFGGILGVLFFVLLAKIAKNKTP